MKHLENEFIAKIRRKRSSGRQTTARWRSSEWKGANHSLSEVSRKVRSGLVSEERAVGRKSHRGTLAHLKYIFFNFILADVGKDPPEIRLRHSAGLYSGAI